MDRLKAALRRLNPLNLLKAALKKKALKVVQVEGDKLQEKVKKALLEKGPAAVDAVFDEHQEKLKKLIEGL